LSVGDQFTSGNRYHSCEQDAAFATSIGSASGRLGTVEGFESAI